MEIRPREPEDVYGILVIQLMVKKFRLMGLGFLDLPRGTISRLSSEIRFFYRLGYTPERTTEIIFELYVYPCPH